MSEFLAPDPNTRVKDFAAFYISPEKPVDQASGYDLAKISNDINDKLFRLEQLSIYASDVVGRALRSKYPADVCIVERKYISTWSKTAGFQSGEHQVIKDIGWKILVEDITHIDPSLSADTKPAFEGIKSYKGIALTTEGDLVAFITSGGKEDEMSKIVLSDEASEAIFPNMVEYFEKDSYPFPKLVDSMSIEVSPYGYEPVSYSGLKAVHAGLIQFYNKVNDRIDDPTFANENSVTAPSANGTFPSQRYLKYAPNKGQWEVQYK